MGGGQMIRLASIINTFESAFLAQYRERLRPEHTRALAAMKHCRTQASPKMQVACTQCDHQTLVPHSCGHRHCPHCQHHESQQWLERQLAKQVPAEYFLITFTLPAEFRALAWAHQGVLYDLLLRCAWETLRTFSQNDRQLRGVPGAIAVLHTNTREHAFHPHVHLVMPAAALDAKDQQWRTKRPGKTKAGYLFNHKALAKVFRAKMLAGIEAASLQLPERYPQQWVVDCKSVGTGKPALIYLGRYLYRGVIREKDILACDNGQVRYRFRNAKTGKFEQRTVPGARFPLAHRAARLAQGLPARAQLRLPAPQLQAPDRLAAGGAEVRSRSNHPMDQATRADPVCVLWRADDDRANTDSTHGLDTHHHSDSHSGNTLIV